MKPTALPSPMGRATSDWWSSRRSLIRQTSSASTKTSYRPECRLRDEASFWVRFPQNPVLASALIQGAFSCLQEPWWLILPVARQTKMPTSYIYLFFWLPPSSALWKEWLPDYSRVVVHYHPVPAFTFAAVKHLISSRDQRLEINVLGVRYRYADRNAWA